MKKVEIWAGKVVNAYTFVELELLCTVGKKAQDLWYEEWKNQGGKDEGTCCGGKAIRVYFIPKGKRKVEEVPIAACSWVQGNISASKSVAPALAYLAQMGIEAEYYDGWMD